MLETAFTILFEPGEGKQQKNWCVQRVSKVSIIIKESKELPGDANKAVYENSRYNKIFEFRIAEEALNNIKSNVGSTISVLDITTKLGFHSLMSFPL